MKLEIEAINHVGIVVRDLAAADRFYGDVLGLARHHERETWFVLNPTSTLHLVPMPQAGVDETLRHRIQHVALQVPDLRVVLGRLLDRDAPVFQMGFDGGRKRMTSTDEPIDFGTGSLFVYDPDGNLIEFMQLGHGVFK